MPEDDGWTDDEEIAENMEAYTNKKKSQRKGINIFFKKLKFK